MHGMKTPGTISGGVWLVVEENVDSVAQEHPHGFGIKAGISWPHATMCVEECISGHIFFEAHVHQEINAVLHVSLLYSIFWTHQRCGFIQCVSANSSGFRYSSVLTHLTVAFWR